MRKSICILLFIVSLCLQAYAQEFGTNKRFWATKVTLQDIKSGVIVSKKIDIPVSITWVNEKVTIYAQMYQEYEIVSSGNTTELNGQKMVTWYVTNQKGITGRMTLGIIKSEGLKLMITYPDLAWTYDIFEEKKKE